MSTGEILRRAGLRSTYLHAASMGSVALCIGLWIRAKTVDQDERGNAERRALFVEFNRTQFSRRQAAEAAVRTAQAQFLEAQQVVADLTARRALLTRLWHYFKRRDLDHRLVGAGGALGLATMQVEESRQPGARRPGKRDHVGRRGVAEKIAVEARQLAFAEESDGKAAGGASPPVAYGLGVKQGDRGPERLAVEAQAGMAEGDVERAGAPHALASVGASPAGEYATRE